MEKKLIEIARSFSFKLNLGNYQMADFFCSQKAEVSEEEAEVISDKLYMFCKKEVEKSVATYLKEVEFKRLKAEVAKMEQAKKDLGTDGTKSWDEKKQELYNTNSKIQEELEATGE